jgi:hypothetical protein
MQTQGTGLVALTDPVVRQLIRQIVSVRTEGLPGCGAVFGQAVPDVLKGLGAFVFRDSEVKEDALDCFILQSKALRSVERPVITATT